MTSASYMQTSDIAEKQHGRVDPGNHLFLRMPMRRVEAEVVRDAMLSVSVHFGSRSFWPARSG